MTKVIIHKIEKATDIASVVISGVVFVLKAVELWLKKSLVQWVGGRCRFQRDWSIRKLEGRREIYNQLSLLSLPAARFFPSTRDRAPSTGGVPLRTAPLFSI